MSSHAPTAAIETHLSRLFFSPDRVFKQLKPIVFPFVDFSDTKIRCEAATHEFERNQGISPDVYLGLADIYEDGEIVDRMIVMRRLREEDALTNALHQGDDHRVICTAARHVASMHAGLLPLAGSQAEPASAEAIAANWNDNFESIQNHLGSVIDPEDFLSAKALAETYVAGRRRLFDQRIEDGWVRDGHGDLRAEHIYLTANGPRMIDCIAFDDRLRISDALADVAFLAMDLDRLVGPEAARVLMRAWNEFTNESHPSSLAHFYVAYRAHVRCKIACLRHEQGDPGAAATAREYHDQALRHLKLAQIRLILVGGGPGTGKSTIAEGVASATGAVWIRADEIRKDLAGMGHDDHAFAEPGEGIYSEAMSARVDDEIERQTKALLQLGVSVVLDSTWRRADQRAKLRSIGSDAATPVFELRCVVSAAEAKERIARRMASVYNPSDASPDLVDFIGANFDAWPEATEIDTSVAIAESITAACRAIEPPAARSCPSQAQPQARFVVDLSVLRDVVLLSRGLDGA